MWQHRARCVRVRDNKSVERCYGPGPPRLRHCFQALVVPVPAVARMIKPCLGTTRMPAACSACSTHLGACCALGKADNMPESWCLWSAMHHEREPSQFCSVLPLLQRTL